MGYQEDLRKDEESKDLMTLLNLPWTFTPFPKISRLNRDICITEKIDGTNAAVGVTPEGTLYAQSRNRIIFPGKDDNMGFALWVQQNVDSLKLLGPGIHFGEWWGVGIGRGYDLHERRFSLFNVARWFRDENGLATILLMQSKGCNIRVVPVLYEGPWTWESIEYPFIFAPHEILERLRISGSHAALNYMKPEGIVVYHKAGNVLFKATIEKDQEWKGKTNAVI